MTFETASKSNNHVDINSSWDICPPLSSSIFRIGTWYCSYISPYIFQLQFEWEKRKKKKRKRKRNIKAYEERDDFFWAYLESMILELNYNIDK